MAAPPVALQPSLQCYLGPPMKIHDPKTSSKYYAKFHRNLIIGLKRIETKR